MLLLSLFLTATLVSGAHDPSFRGQQCKEGHDLIRTSKRYSRSWCDVCAADLAPYSEMWFCGICRWVKCVACYVKDLPSEVSADQELREALKQSALEHEQAPKESALEQAMKQSALEHAKHQEELRQLEQARQQSALKGGSDTPIFNLLAGELARMDISFVATMASPETIKTCVELYKLRIYANKGQEDADTARAARFIKQLNTVEITNILEALLNTDFGRENARSIRELIERVSLLQFMSVADLMAHFDNVNNLLGLE